MEYEKVQIVDVNNQPVALGQLSLADLGMSMTCNGQTVSVGTGAACLGHPLNAAVWLANVMARCGRPLRAGDVVLTGALGPMVQARPGEAYVARIEGLGEVRALFG